MIKSNSTSKKQLKEYFSNFTACSEYGDSMNNSTIARWSGYIDSGKFKTVKHLAGELVSLSEEFVLPFNSLDEFYK
jgi:hypothetical protein